MEAAENPSPPCELKGFPGGIIVPDEESKAMFPGSITEDEYTRRCNTDENILRNMTAIANTTTVDDGYVYPKNATDEEKSAIDA
jgi:hypothetical protein